MKALILDDEHEDLELVDGLVRDIFHAAGLEIDGNPEQQFKYHKALESARVGPDYALALVDISWPPPGTGNGRAIDFGFALIRELRGRCPNVTIVAYTRGERDSDAYLREALEAGADRAYFFANLFETRTAEVEVGAILAAKQSDVLTVDKEQPSMSQHAEGIPAIDSSTSVQTYLLALDTIAYSQRKDKRQLDIVQAFLGGLRSDPGISVLSPEDYLCLFTGDGVIVAFLQPNHALLPLEAGLRVLEHVAEGDFYSFKVRLGVHAGSASLVDFGGGTRQLLGHNINWACRVMGAASENSIAISEPYFADVLQAGRNAPYGLRMEKKVDEDKHGNEIVFYDTTKTSSVISDGKSPSK